MEEKIGEEWLKDLPVQSENPAFGAEEMISCAKCKRTNPPTRLKCFYCGAELEIGAEQSRFLKPNLRKLEAWEKGFNLIFLPEKSSFNESHTAETAKMLNLEREVFTDLIRTNKPLPLARAESEKEAEIVKERLVESGIETFILSDAVLSVEKPQTRLRGLEFLDEKVILYHFNQDEITEIFYGDLALIVTGVIFEKKVEATEKRNKKGENKILQTTEMASDEFVIDVYSREDANGYRILSKGFDFSCLGAEKQILAKDNIRRLAQKLKETATDARYNDDYLQIREGLGNVWEVENRTDSLGLKRESFGRYNLGNLTTVNNSQQFTKYSRLQWHIL